MGFFKKKTPEHKASLHNGHVAALGEKFAMMVSQKGISHTAMRGEHIIWHPHEDTVAVLGWGNTREIKWPEQALSHADDIKVFYQSHGPGHTGSLRLGYVFQLGPIAESIFFEVASRTTASNFKDLPEGMTHQWITPNPSLALKNNSMLTDDAAMEITRKGISARQRKETDLAKQSFLRCFIAGLASGSAGQQYASMINLVTTYVDEQRWLRAYSLCMLAMLLATGLPEENKVMADNQNKPLYFGLSEKIDEADRARIASFFSPSQSVSVPELMWQLEDYEIQSVIGIVP